MSQILEEKLHIKIYIENDTRSMAYGEYLQGVVKGEKNILFINISWGLGIGIIIDGKVYFGKSGSPENLGTSASSRMRFFAIAVKRMPRDWSFRFCPIPYPP